jgi:hypothetical protein
MWQLLTMFRAALSPIGTHLWGPLSRRLTTDAGWLPPMFMIAGAGLILTLSFAMVGAAPPAWAKGVGLATWITWVIVGGLASLRVAARSVYNLVRLGPLGFRLPRWWFEVGRLSFIVLLFAVLTLVVIGGLWLQGVRGLDDFQILVEAVVLVSATGFAMAAVAGYGLSLVFHLPRRGRAYECVHYFGTILGSITLLVLAIYSWPQQWRLLDAAVSVGLGILGLALLLGGFLSIIDQYQKHET